MFLKLFAGILITSEIRMHLHSSMPWKEAQILKEFDGVQLQATHFHEEKYIGKFLANTSLTIEELRVEEQSIFDKLQEYCPHLKTEKLKVKIFPQQFIS